MSFDSFGLGIGVDDHFVSDLSSSFGVMSSGMALAVDAAFCNSADTGVGSDK